jgi:hypothetical protein
MLALSLAVLLSARPALAAEPVKVEAADARSYSDAAPDMLERRAQACRDDLKDFGTKPGLALFDRLVLCLEHPDAGLRSDILDQLARRELWDRPDYETLIAPRLRALCERFRDDPDRKVKLHAEQLATFLYNGERWRDWDSPAGKARQEKADRLAVLRDAAVVGGICLATGLAAGLIRKQRLRGRHRRD